MVRVRYIYIYIRVVQETRGGMRRGKKEDRYDLLPAANSVSPWCAPTAFAFHPSFSLSRLTELNFSPPFPPPSPHSTPFVPRHLSKWLTASFIIRLSAFLHFYPPFSSIYCPRGEFVWSQYVTSNDHPPVLPKYPSPISSFEDRKVTFEKLLRFNARLE